jgi:hypothetical protein
MQFDNKRRRYRCLEGELYTVIISSLGAIFNFAFHNLAFIPNTKSRAVISLWFKCLVIAAIKGSFNLRIRAKPGIFRAMQNKYELNKLEEQDVNLNELERTKTLI